MNNPTQVLPVVSLINGQAKTTSLDIAKTFGKLHKNVLVRIESLDCSPEFATANFLAVVRSVQAGIHQREEKYYEITRDGFAFLCMGFTGAKAARFKEAYIAAFNAMEAALSQTTPFINTPYGVHAPAPMFAGLAHGRYLLVAEKGETMIRDISHCNIIDAQAVLNMKRDLRTLQKAMTELQERLLVFVGDRHPNLLDEPLNISIGASS